MHKANKFYREQIQDYLDECHFDLGVSSSKAFPIDEAHLARMLTRIVVSTATVITTTLSLKQYAKEVYINYKRNKLC